MLKVNIKTQRKIKGLTQEELAIRLNVVRQTVSKWEKGHSVPDADLLIQMADIFEVSVSDLLGAEVENDKEMGDVAQQLSRINEQLAIMNRRARRIWKAIAIVGGATTVLTLFIILFNYTVPSAVVSSPPVGEATPASHESSVVLESIVIAYDTRSVSDITVRVGESFPLNVITVPNFEGEIEWISSDPSVFSIVPMSGGSKATLTALSPSASSTTLTVRAGGNTAQCIIRVREV